MRQLELGFPAPVSSAGLATYLSARLSRSVRVIFTQNRSSMVSFREREGRLFVRLHHMFQRAGDGELNALGNYINKPNRDDGKVLDHFISTHLASSRRAVLTLKTRGRFHDLLAILLELNETFFHGTSEARISWGARGSRRYRRSIQLGCYVSEERLIRIHPALDQSFVPRFYIAWIIFHELLHEVLGVEKHGTRRSVHPPEFIAMEQSYPDYGLCKVWERDNLHRLLKFR